MASTLFVDGVSVIYSAWLNDVNSAAYTNFGDGSSYTGNLTVGASKFVVAAATGNMSVVGNIHQGGNAVTTPVIDINGAANTDKFLTWSNAGSIVWEIGVQATTDILLITSSSGNAIQVAKTGGVTISALAGAGTRTVVASATGVLSAP